jgi:hypothetical protein
MLLSATMWLNTLLGIAAFDYCTYLLHDFFEWSYVKKTPGLTCSTGVAIVIYSANQVIDSRVVLFPFRLRRELSRTGLGV